MLGNSTDAQKIRLDNSYLKHEDNWIGQNKPDIILDESSETEESSSDSGDDGSSLSDSYNDDERTSPNRTKAESTSEDLQESASSYSIADDCSMHVEEDKVEAPASSTPLKRRGKYLQPCQQFHYIGQRHAKRPITRKLIQNYNIMGHRKICRVVKPGSKPIKVRVSVSTSTSIDSIIEILVTGYFTLKRFKKFIDDLMNKPLKCEIKELLGIIFDYVKEFHLTGVYQKRIQLISKLYGEHELNKFSWTKTVGELIEKVMFPSIFVEFCCNECDKSTSFHHFNCVKVPGRQKILTPHVLFSYILPTIQKFATNCEICQQGREGFTFEIKHMICVGVEDLTVNTEDCYVELGKLTRSLLLGQQEFVLVGLIAFEEPIGKQVIRHYVAYCRENIVNDSWFKYDDAENSPVKIDTTNSIHAALLVYIECDPSTTIMPH